MTAKIAIVVDGSVAVGLVANAIAAAAFSMGARRPGLCGADLTTADGMPVAGARVI